LVFLTLLAVAIAEQPELAGAAATFSLTRILFEVISGYGTVGLSLSYPGINASFSGVLCDFSKVCIILLMWLGRNRGLPDRVDRAVQVSSSFFVVVHSQNSLFSFLRSFIDLLLEHLWKKKALLPQNRRVGLVHECLWISNQDKVFISKRNRKKRLHRSLDWLYYK
jgi:hypothetical protein